MTSFRQLFKTAHPLIGMLHLPPLPGSPNYTGTMQHILDAAQQDAQVLLEAGFAGLIIENLGDAPYYPDHAPAETVAAMSVVAAHVRRQTKLPVGVNVLRNDAQSAMAIAAAADLQFIRVNVLIGTSVTDQGLISGQAHLVARKRQQLHAENVLIFADLRVKHAAPLVERELAQEIDDLFERALADAIIISGTGSGKPIDFDFLREVKKLAADRPVLIGSGLNLENAKASLAVADGAIVGSSIKIDGKIHNRVDEKRGRRLMELVKS
ncbi:MAG: BtpA/SgcQ family protein [candidate division KSB1 bacterium]|nr:BtpA/SgcQ family protein [candidate division KSB1 bacterium]MDZ7366176.1 BtpA/SgcQ family protein [candidate division KSB1 bacterium]MDZ7404182.1 BtpA/SgcQ family protein [candidate division KSB1 bacterium]